MKTSKKLFGLGLLTFILIAAVLLLSPKRTLAATAFTAADLKNSTYTFQDGANISAKFTFNNSADVIFTDRNITDNNRNYKQTDDNTVCGAGNDYGITIASGADLTKATIPATIKVGYPVGSNCTPPNLISASISIKNPNQLAATSYQWDGDQITTLNGTSNGSTLSLKPNTNNLIYTDFGSDCGSGTIILLDSAGASTGKEYKVETPGRTTPANLGNYPAISAYFTSGTCRITDGPNPVTLAGKKGQTATGGSGTATPADSDSCEANALGQSLSWLFCPLLSTADDFINGTGGSGGLLGIYEDQLSYRVEDSLGVTGGAKDNNLQTTWALLKNIATAALVIIIMIMIFSQAVGSGPFDAYTVRKMLPRLAAAVILMQLSWYIVAWIVNLVDDIGGSLFDILYAPFQGADQMSLGHLFAHAGIGSGETLFVSLLTIGGIAILGLAALPAVLLMAFTAVVALLTALVVLVFRKIIIILCLITAPLAILAWILPGTERYWKMWLDNFLKVLFMYPIIVGLIAAGHIFAYIVGSSAADSKGAGNFLTLVLIMIGVFGPLFLIPKAFRWGGAAMAAAGGAINTASSRFAGKESALGKGVQGFGERYQGSKAKQYNPSDDWRKRALRRVQSGHMLPTERSRRLAIASGNKWAAERTDEAEAIMGRTYEKALSNGYKKHIVDEDGNYVGVRTDPNTGEMLDAAGNVVNDWKEAEELYRGTDKSKGTVMDIKGVEAGKQALVDMAGWTGSDANNRAAQAAIKQLMDTHSEIELQSARIQGGTNEGRRISEVGAWNDTLENSPQHYSAAAGRRPDAAPDVIEGAEKKLGYTYDQAYAADNSTKLTSGLTKRQEMVRNLDRERLRTAISRLSPEGLAGAHYGFFQDIARTGDASLAESLRDTMVNFQTNGGVAGQNAIGALRGGKEGHVNKALSLAGVSLDTLAPNRTVTVSTPGELKIEHGAAVVQNIPPTASLAAGTASREAFKLQLKSDPVIVKTLANAIAYDIATPDQKDILAELRLEALDKMTDPASTAEEVRQAQDSWNSIVAQIQQSYTQRINDTSAAAAARGRDPAVARAAAGNRLSQDIINLEPTAPDPPPTIPDLRKL